jgi:hypothetical protein
VKPLDRFCMEMNALGGGEQQKEKGQRLVVI